MVYFGQYVFGLICVRIEGDKTKEKNTQGACTPGQHRQFLVPMRAKGPPADSRPAFINWRFARHWFGPNLNQSSAALLQFWLVFCTRLVQTVFFCTTASAVWLVLRSGLVETCIFMQRFWFWFVFFTGLVEMCIFYAALFFFF